MAGGNVLHKVLLHARDPGGAVGMVGCQDHAARVLHLHGHRHMSALLPVTKAGDRGVPMGTDGRARGPVTSARAWPGSLAASRHRLLSGELCERDTALLPVRKAELAYIQKHRPQNNPQGSYYVPRKLET